MRMRRQINLLSFPEREEREREVYIYISAEIYIYYIFVYIYRKKYIERFVLFGAIPAHPVHRGRMEMAALRPPLPRPARTVPLAPSGHPGGLSTPKQSINPCATRCELPGTAGLWLMPGGTGGTGNTVPGHGGGGGGRGGVGGRMWGFGG